MCEMERQIDFIQIDQKMTNPYTLLAFYLKNFYINI